jgi:ATP-dependent Clp protease ATP-binding subunit ClpB
VGYDESGQLTEAVRRKPYSVVLLDEIEKAHPDVFNILLQVLDDGRLTDNKGRTADFRNTIIIMTSNIGSHIIQQNLGNENTHEVSEADFEHTRLEVFQLLKQQLRPEFLNRIDDIIMFKPLTKAEIKEVVNLQFIQVQKMLLKNGIHVDLLAAALDHLAEAGFDPQYGARPVKRVLQRELLNELSKMILSDVVDKSKTILVDF